MTELQADFVSMGWINEVIMIDIEDFIAMMPVNTILNVDEMTRMVEAYNRGEIDLATLQAFAKSGRRTSVEAFLAK